MTASDETVDQGRPIQRSLIAPVAGGAESHSEPGIIATLRLRVGAEHVHYGDGIVAGAFTMELLGDLATELCIRAAGHEGLFRAYESVEFLVPVKAGDYLEGRGTIVASGLTSRTCHFEVWKVIQAAEGPYAWVLDDPVLVLTARGTVVIPSDV